MIGTLFGVFAILFLFAFVCMFGLATQLAVGYAIPASVFWKGAAIGFVLSCGAVALIVFTAWMYCR
jgi:hypothetical protein